MSPSQSNPEPVVIPEDEFDAIRLYAESAYPRMICGAILTRGTDRRVLPLRNIQDDLHAEDPEKHPRDSRTAFYVAHDDLVRLGRLEHEDFFVSVLYRSYTDIRAYFSGTDRRAAVSDSGSPHWPGTAYLVVSIVDGRAEDSAAFRWDSQLRDFADVPLRISRTGREAQAPKSPPPPARALRVFLCHSSGDKEFVRELCRRLKGGKDRPLA
jgi:proteasome lid subunit RPN8/RPN11